MTGAMRHFMNDQRIVIHMLVFVGYHAAVKRAFRPLSPKKEISTVSGDTIMQSDDVVVYPTICLLFNKDITHSHILMMCFLKAIKLQRSILSHKSLNHLGSQELSIIGCMITEQEFDTGTFLQNNQHPAIDHQINIRAKNINHLYSTFNLYMLRDID